MAVMTLRFNPKTIGLATQVRIILPTGVHQPDTDFRKLYGEKKPLPVLWLLHGGSDNYADWHDCTPVQVLADKYSYAVVMPDAQTSSYANMAYGPNWLDYFRTELPEYIYTHFPVSRRREDNFISGMSMGGGGAYLNALDHPELYGGVLDLYGALRYTGSLGTFLEMDAEQLGEFRHYIICGNHDMYCFDIDHIKMGRHLSQLEVPCVFEIDNGEHDPDFYLPRLKDGFAYILNGIEPVQ